MDADPVVSVVSCVVPEWTFCAVGKRLARVIAVVFCKGARA